MKSMQTGVIEPLGIDARIQAALPKFEQLFGRSAGEVAAYHAPGRVNLIGEHTDYNGGYVLPAAIEYGTLVLVAPRADAVIRVASTNRQLQVEAEIDKIHSDPKNDWANYPLGVAHWLRKVGFEIGGADLLFDGNIPGGGLSSSASLELATGVALLGAWGQTMDRVELVKLCQKVENEFVGVNCGIMDQYAVGMGKEGQTVFLDCRAIKHRYVPLSLPHYKIVIANTNKPRSLVVSKYNERRSECEAGLEMLKRVLPNIECLADVSVEDFEAHADAITDADVLKRIKHVVYEDARVLAAIKALEGGDLVEFGRLMIQSHESLRDFYEVTGKELDSLVEEALKVDGVVGSRMTGAGFGGCTVSIVREDQIEAFASKVAEGYTKATGLVPEFYVTEAADGARKVG
jgi:galactokinase